MRIWYGAVPEFETATPGGIFVGPLGLPHRIMQGRVALVVDGVDVGSGVDECQDIG